MIITGLVSVTFRALAPREIVALASRSGLKAIEWGGDVHVPPGDLARAQEVGRATVDAGMRVAGYGSYFRLGREEDFVPILKAAEHLGAPSVRIAAGDRGSAQATPGYFRAAADELQLVARQAGNSGMRIALEFHADTLTDTTESTQKLLGLAGDPGVRTHWQAPLGWSDERLAESIAALAPEFENVHIYNIEGSPPRRLPLRPALARWRKLLALANRPGAERPVLLEFVRDDAPAAFADDAAALNELADELNRPEQGV